MLNHTTEMDIEEKSILLSPIHFPLFTRVGGELFLENTLERILPLC